MNKRKSLSITLILVLVFTMISPFEVIVKAETDPVAIFEDPELNKTMHEYVGKEIDEPIYKSDLANALEEYGWLTGTEGYLMISRTQAKNLKGIEIFRDLGVKSFTCSACFELEDISSLDQITSLERIRITNAKVNNIGSIGHLPLLKSLQLNYVNLTNADIQEISNAKGLEFLAIDGDLSGTSINDISPLKDLKELSTLSLKNHQIKDISILNSLTKLNLLALTNNLIDDFSVINELPNLKNLEIHGNHLTTLDDIVNNNTLTSAMFKYNYINIFEEPEKINFDKVQSSGVGYGDNTPQLRINAFSEISRSPFYMIKDSEIESLTLDKGQTTQIYYASEYTYNGTSFSPYGPLDIHQIELQSLDNNVVTITENGLLEAINPGTTEIVAKLDGIDSSYTKDIIKVTVIDSSPKLEDFKISPKTATIYVDESQQYTATAYYSDGTEKDVTNESSWSIENQNIADIENNAIALGKSEGETKVTATFEGLSDNAELIVKDREPTLVSLEVTPKTATIKVDDNQQYIATATFSDGSTKNVTSESDWSISEQEIAIINSNGLTTGKMEGQTSVTANYKGLSDNAILIVEEEYTPLPVELIGLEVTPKTATILIGETQDYAAIAYYSDGTQKNVSDISQWNVVNRGIAEAINGESITTHATFLGKKSGKTQVTATFEGLTDNAELIVKPLPEPPVTLESIEVIPKTATIYIGDNQQYKAIATYSNGSKEDVTNQSSWKVLENTIASIDNQGLANGKQVGKTDITAEFNGMTDTAELNVIKKEPVLVSLEVTPKKAEIYVDETQQYKATAYYDDGSTKDVTLQSIWTIEDSDIASINNGLAKGLNEGKVKVTATFNGLDDDALLIVKVIEKTVPEEPEVPKEVPNEPTPEEPIPNEPNKDIPGVPKTGDGSTVGKYNENYVILLSIAALISVAIFRRKATE